VLATAIARKWRKNANVAAWKGFKHVAPKRPGGDDDWRRAMVSRQEAPAVFEKIGAVDTMGSRAHVPHPDRRAHLRSDGRSIGRIDFDAKSRTIPAIG
jgi:hypothetical protein